MVWMAYAIIALGVLLLLLIPFLVYIIRTDPMQALRSIWHGTLTPEFARTVGILIVLTALIGGIWSILKGISFL